MIACDRCHTTLEEDNGRILALSALDCSLYMADLCMDCTNQLTAWVAAGPGPTSQEIDRDRLTAYLWERKMTELNNAQSTANLSTPRVWVSQGPQGPSEEQLQEALKEVRSRMEFWNGR